jgi:biopolymer transport protein ExbD
MASTTTNTPDDPMIAGINVTPFVDIALVLLIIFIVTAAFVTAQASIPIDLPRAVPPHTTAHIDSTMRIAIDATGHIAVDGRDVGEPAFRALVAERHGANPELRAVIAADRAVPHGRVVEVIDALRTAGMARFSLESEVPVSPAAR